MKELYTATAKEIKDRKFRIKLKVRNDKRGFHSYTFKIVGYKPTFTTHTSNGLAPNYTNSGLGLLFQQPFRQIY